jgi:hypothetical protein
MTWRAVIPLVALAAAGCTWGERPAMIVTGATPAEMTRGVKGLITVTGAGFMPDVAVDFDSPSRSSVCFDLRVELRTSGLPPVPLRDARVISDDVVRAKLDGDAGKAAWDLVVVRGDGREATLRAALNVTNCLGVVNTACDDGEPCTYDAAFGTPADGIDKCMGNSSCGGTAMLPDGAECDFACAVGGNVPGTCRSGACLPAAGTCDPPPACTDS